MHYCSPAAVDQQVYATGILYNTLGGNRSRTGVFIYV